MTPGMQALAVYSAQIALVVAAATAVAWLVRLRVPVVRCRGGATAACCANPRAAGALWLWRAPACCASPCPSRHRPAPPPINVTFGQVDAVVAAARLALRRMAGPPGRWRVVLAGRGVADRCAWALASCGCDACAATARPAQLDESGRGPARRRGAARGAALDEPSRPASGVRPAPPAGPFAPEPRDACPSKLARRCSATSCCTWRGTTGRGSWPRTLVRAVMWFHPGVWWLLDQLQVSREQVVDALAVRRTGARKPYMRGAALVRRGASGAAARHRVSASPSPADSHATSRTGAAHEPDPPRRHRNGRGRLDGRRQPRRGGRVAARSRGRGSGARTASAARDPSG